VSRRTLIAAAAIAAAATLTAVYLVRRPPATPRLLVLITMDATRRDHLGCYGYGANTSPEIDGIARRGMVFDDAVSQASWTTASVATLVTSTFPCQHGLRWTSGSQSPFAGLETNFIKTLASRGFKTASFMAGVDLKRKIPTSELTGKATRWLRQNRNDKCVLWIYTYETHYPYAASASCAERLDPGYQGPYRLRFEDMEILKKVRLGRFEKSGLTRADVRHLAALYDCQIAQADKAIGAFVDTLEAWDVLDRSAVVIFADHGEEFLEHGTIEHGQQLYEETIRVPLIVLAPSVTDRPGRVAEQVGLVDLAPTLMELAGLEPSPAFEGRSLASMLSRRYTAPRGATRPCGIPWDCLIAESVAHRNEKKVLRCPPWKLFFDPFFGATELYNLIDDPGETRNLIDARPEVTSRLSETLLKMEKYYPGGWFLAWRGTDGTAGRRVSGKVELGTAMLEAVPHNFFPEVDTRTDSLVVGPDGRSVRFAAGPGSGWKGLEIRMAGPAEATLTLEAVGLPAAKVAVGRSGRASQLPVALSPDAARVGRKDLRDLFLGADADFLVFWCDPGAEPQARTKQNEDLRKELKAIGYIQ
jgi:arylsulfatase A-like enzyme